MESPSAERLRMLDAISHACRAFQNASDEVDEAVSSAVGINRTDLRCLDIIERLGPITAGELAIASGLTTGAMTTLLDRLERAGYATRTRDTVDRRKVQVDLTPVVREHADRFYGGLKDCWEGQTDRFTDAELRTILTFLELARDLNATHAARLRTELTAQAESLQRELSEPPPSGA